MSCPRNSLANFWDKQATKTLILLVSTLNQKSGGLLIRDTSGACAAAIVAAGWIGVENATVLALFAVLYALTGPLGAAGVRSLLPRLVPPEALGRVNAIDTAIWAVADILGPAMAGLLSAAMGPDAAMLVVGGTYGGAAACLLRVPALAGRGAGGAPLMAQSLEGLLLMLRHRALRGLSLSYSFYQLSWGVLVVAAPVVAARHLPPAAAQAATGALWAAAGIAGGIGALAAGHLHTAGREARIMAAGMLVSAVALWPVAASFGFGGMALGMCVAGLAAGPVDVAALTLRQRATDPTLLGRVLSISMSLNLLGLPIGSALAGMMITRAPAAAFAVAALAALVGAVMARRISLAEG